MFCYYTVTDVLIAQVAGTSYTAYAVQKSTGFLMGTSTGKDIYNTAASAYYKAIEFTTDVIAKSYQFLLDNGILNTADVTTTYTVNGVTFNMRILLSNVKDATGTMEVDMVYVSLEEIAVTSAPTVMPTTSPSIAPTEATIVDPSTGQVVVDNNDDELLRAAADGAIAAAVFASLIFIIVIVFIIFWCLRQPDGDKPASKRADIELSSSTNRMQEA